MLIEQYRKHLDVANALLLETEAKLVVVELEFRRLHVELDEVKQRNVVPEEIADLQVAIAREAKAQHNED